MFWSLLFVWMYSIGELDKNSNRAIFSILCDQYWKWGLKLKGLYFILQKDEINGFLYLYISIKMYLKYQHSIPSVNGVTLLKSSSRRQNTIIRKHQFPQILIYTFPWVYSVYLFRKTVKKPKWLCTKQYKYKELGIATQ